MMTYMYKIIILIIIIIGIIIFNSLTKKYQKSGYQNLYMNDNPWPTDLIKRFNIYQTTVNKHVNKFNLDQLQKQVTAEEAEEYLKTGFWSWPDDLKNLYIESVWSNTIIKIDPQYALNYAMKVYNKNAIRELLAWNTKEGKFLLYGSDIGVSDSMPTNMNNTIKCSNEFNSVMQKKIYTGMNLWNGYINSTTTNIKPEDMPKEIPGFSFVKSPCNPCVALNSPGDFSCPFNLNTKENGKHISEPWKQLWGL